jgi:hypothetical protein
VAIDAAPAGEVEARAILVGPDEDFETLGVVLHGALATGALARLRDDAYFLPDRVLIAALRLRRAARRAVDVVLPATSNLRSCRGPPPRSSTR